MSATTTPAPTRASARQRILDAAEGLVMERGFAATTVDAVLGAAGASKGAFFHHFPSKAALGRALVERYAAADAALLDAWMAEAEARSGDPAGQVVEFLRVLEDAVTLPAGEYPGCLFVSFIYEADLAGAHTADVVSEAILLWRRRLLDKLEAAAARRPPDPPVDLPSLADQFFTTFEGAFLLGRALEDPSSAARQLAHLRRYVELLLGVAPAGGPGAGARPPGSYT